MGPCRKELSLVLLDRRLVPLSPERFYHLCGLVLRLTQGVFREKSFLLTDCRLEKVEGTMAPGKNHRVLLTDSCEKTSARGGSGVSVTFLTTLLFVCGCRVSGEGLRWRECTHPLLIVGWCLTFGVGGSPTHYFDPGCYSEGHSPSTSL